jgi:hypothetical protein
MAGASAAPSHRQLFQPIPPQTREDGFKLLGLGDRDHVRGDDDVPGVFTDHQEDKFAILRPGDRLGFRGNRFTFRVGDCVSFGGCIGHVGFLWVGLSSSEISQILSS